MKRMFPRRTSRLIDQVDRLSLPHLCSSRIINNPAAAVNSRNASILRAQSPSISFSLRAKVRLAPGQRAQRRWYIKPELIITTDTVVQEDNPLSPHISTCLSADSKWDRYDTRFAVAFLGSGAGTPSRERLSSSTVLHLGGQTLVFDVGEGTQRQLMFTRFSLKAIQKIFITHMHGDHIFGLPGLLLAINQASQARQRSGATSPPWIIDLYGPPGLFNYIAMTLKYTFSRPTSLSIVVHELMGSFEETQLNRQQAKREKFKESTAFSLFHKTIDRNEDGTWTLCTPDSSPGSNKVHISAAELFHVNGIPTFGYVVKEKEPERSIDPEKAKACGIMPGRKLRLLKQGNVVASDDGRRMVNPDEVLIDRVTRKARKFALLGDCCELTASMYKLCQDSDILVHEATIDSGKSEMAKHRGHSTPEMAGKVACDVNARVLVLNHLSAKITESDEASKLVAEAAQGNQGVSSIVAAHDFMQIKVPNFGFELSAPPNKSYQHGWSLPSLFVTFLKLFQKQ